MKLKRKPDITDYINIVVILLLTALSIWLGIGYTRMFGKADMKDPVGSAENLRDFVLSFGSTGFAVVVLLHIIQVVVSYIPSVLVQFVGGMIYGVPVGMLTSLIGIPLGTAIAFYLARILGRKILTLFVSQKNIDKMESIFTSDTSSIVLLILFVLPTPKDFIAYFVGLTNMKASKFFLISVIGRLPGMLIATYLGAHIFERNYAFIAAVVLLCAIFTAVVYRYKDNVISFLSKLGLAGKPQDASKPDADAQAEDADDPPPPANPSEN
ncbi:MAG: VTT domain-containing protein [Eubacteriaceae bacterium]|nr:VTT domain-containing protein [Eubacteriaceae bacterium]